MATLALCMALVTANLMIGAENVSPIFQPNSSSPRIYSLFSLAQKLVFFVVIPMILFSKRFGLSMRDFGLQWVVRPWFEKKHIRILLGFATILILLQYFVGQAAAPVRAGEFSTGQLFIGMPLTYIWLIIEVGLVEEFFFRVMIQSRRAARFKSDLTGIVVAALLFGLAHAPGLYLRRAGAASPVGSDPSLLFVIGYSVVVLSAAGLFLGIIWARTRNLLLIIMIHAAGDLLPNFSEFARTWHL